MLTRRQFVVRSALAAAGTRAFAQSAAKAEAMVKMPLGQLRGEAVNGVRVFRGVPFAKPPVGELRFRAPEPVQPWQGVRDATRFAAAAMQPGEKGAEQNEDCLYLNVWTPPAGGQRALPGVRVDPWRRVHGRTRVRSAVRRNGVCAGRDRLHHGGVPAGRARLSRCEPDPGARLCGQREQWAARPGCRARVGEGECGGVRRGSAPGDDGRRERGSQADRPADGQPSGRAVVSADDLGERRRGTDLCQRPRHGGGAGLCEAVERADETGGDGIAGCTG